MFRILFAVVMLGPIFLAPLSVDAGGKLLTLEIIRNSEYTLGVGGERIRLNDGSFQSGNFKVSLEQAALGDLNDDGIPDAAVILGSSGGGSGYFFDLVIVLNHGGGTKQVASVSLGDRTKFNAIRILAGELVIDMTVRGVLDPMCCPTRAEVVRFRFMKGELWRATTK